MLSLAHRGKFPCCADKNITDRFLNAYGKYGRRIINGSDAMTRKRRRTKITRRKINSRLRSCLLGFYYQFRQQMNMGLKISH